jgi:hypothetical protein
MVLTSARSELALLHETWYHRNDEIQALERTVHC